MTLVRVRGLSYRYPETDHLALDGVDLDVEPGEIVGVVGANGAGKTTLLQALVGLVPHHHGGAVGGSVVTAGVDVHASSVAEVTRRAGFVFATPVTQISGAKETVAEELAFGMENAGVPPTEMRRRIAATVTAVGLEGLEERAPMTLSGGELQRVAIASVLVLRPEVLVADEPTTQLDPLGARAVLETLSGLAAGGMAVVLATHDVDWLADHADRVVGLVDGRVSAAGTPGEVFGGDALAGTSAAVPTATAAARALGRRHPDGRWPVTADELRAVAWG